MKVARQQQSVSLSIEYLGNCKEWAKDAITLYVSNWNNATCLPIATDGSLRDVNDIKATHFCVNINEKKSIINFVGFPTSYALSFVPSNPFRSFKSQNYVRRPNCEVRQQYLTTSISVTECKDNRVKLDTGYVVSEDRIYILPEGYQVSTCFVNQNATGCCPYINTNINNGICPNFASKRKMKLFFLNIEQPHSDIKYDYDKKKKTEQAEINPTTTTDTKNENNNNNAPAETVIEIQAPKPSNEKQLGKNTVDNTADNDQSSTSTNKGKKQINNLSNGKSGLQHHSPSGSHHIGVDHKPSSTQSTSKSPKPSSPSKVNTPAKSNGDNNKAPKPSSSSNTIPIKSNNNKNFGESNPNPNNFNNNNDQPPTNDRDMFFSGHGDDDDYVPFEDAYADEPPKHHKHHEHHEEHHERPHHPEDPFFANKNDNNKPINNGNIIEDDSVDEDDFEFSPIFPEDFHHEEHHHERPHHERPHHGHNHDEDDDGFEPDDSIFTAPTTFHHGQAKQSSKTTHHNDDSVFDSSISHHSPKGKPSTSSKTTHHNDDSGFSATSKFHHTPSGKPSTSKTDLKDKH